MVPILLVWVILVPMATGWMMEAWVDRRRETALQDVASHVGSTVQQLYFSLSREEIAAGTIIQNANVPPFVESTPYVITVSDKKIENSVILDFYLSLMGTSISTTTRVTLGPNAMWKTSIFMSNSTNACIKVEKSVDGILSFSFG